MWDYLLELDPDVALLQEVGDVSPALRDSYACELVPAAWKHGERLKFSTGLLVRGEIMRTVSLTSSIAWLGDVLARFGVNLVGREVRPDAGLVLTAISVHSPAWPVDQDLPEDLDTSAVRLSANPDLWLTDVLWACLKHRPPAPAEPRIVGGDLNSSPTFDVRRPWAGNQETLDRMADLGFVECLRTSQGRPTPTFRHSKGSIKHQIDHLFVTQALAERLTFCSVGSHERVIDSWLSDHLPIVAQFRREPSDQNAGTSQ